MNSDTVTNIRDMVFNGDNGDGTYNNPILPADYSDPDAIRVDDNYFLITSTFQFSPGITVLHSKDMVNWEIIGGAVKDITRINPAYSHSKMPLNGYGRIIWAPCITYNIRAKMFYIHFATPDEGMFIVSASKEGIWKNEWSDVEQVTYPDGSAVGAGWDDCGVLWDDDGQGYLVANNFKSGYKNFLFRLSADGKRLLDNGVLIHEHHDNMLAETDEGSPEAYKMFKKDGYYYFLHNAVVQNDERELFFMRAKHIYGDNEDGTAGCFNKPGKYEHSQKGIVVEGFNQWCQGNLLDTSDIDPKSKKWYFLTHLGSGLPCMGRPVCLIPITWGADGFPYAKNRRAQWKNISKPLVQSKIKHPQTSDDFSKKTLAPQWMWNYQPRDDKWSLSDNPGNLRLYAYKPILENRLETAGNSLVQRSYASKSCIVKTKIAISGMTNGQNAGLQHCSSDLYGAIGVSMDDGVKCICTYGSAGYVYSISRIPNDVNEVFFQSEWNSDMICTLSYSYDDVNYFAIDKYQMQWRKYRGDYVGFFNYNNIKEDGYIDIAYFSYKIFN